MAHISFHRSSISILGTVAIMVVLFSAILVASIPQYLNHKAYADGLSQENLPPATVGSRQASLYVKVNPPVLTTAAAQNAYMQFR